MEEINMEIYMIEMGTKSEKKKVKLEIFQSKILWRKKQMMNCAEKKSSNYNKQTKSFIYKIKYK